MKVEPRKIRNSVVGILLLVFTLIAVPGAGQVRVKWDKGNKPANTRHTENKPVNGQGDIKAGADRTEAYLPLLKGKKVALLVNNTSRIAHTHLADTLQSCHIKIVRIFAPEHGFRGTASAGEFVRDTMDVRLHVPITSLYGKHLKPTAADLKDIDVVVYDIQDVGCRFYTYISTLQYMMEACATAHKALIILDRPNPNGFYVDGPVLDTNRRSFVGLQPIPVVYGMTAAEYANMLTGEHWLNAKAPPDVTYILCKRYTHKAYYTLPVPPSPNLRHMRAVYLYPSLCFFEGTPVSIGRGTDKPFMQFGFPGCKVGNVTFTPQSAAGASNPPYVNQECRGFDLSPFNEDAFIKQRQINLSYLLDMYSAYPDKDLFFTPFFDQLAGGNTLRKQIAENKTETEIRQSWQKDLTRFKSIRRKYLLYTDFE